MNLTARLIAPSPLPALCAGVEPRLHLATCMVMDLSRDKVR